jgi:hypothetical protein
VYTGTVSANNIIGGVLQGQVIRSNLTSGTYGEYVQINSAGGELDFYYQPTGFSPELRGAIWQTGGEFHIAPQGASQMWLGAYASGGNTHATKCIGAWDMFNAQVDRMYNSDGYQYVTNDQHTTDRYLDVSPSSHNHGIPNGTWLRTADGGSVQWAASTLTISPQQHNHFIADY